jgi:hypothetical protein
MGKKIIISENIENLFIQLALNEVFYPEANKVLIIKNYLDKNFIKSTIDDIDNNGYPIKTRVVSMKNSNGDALNTMTTSQLFYLIQDKFKNIYHNKEQRDKLIKQVIKDWCDGKISREGMLSVNSY